MGASNPNPVPTTGSTHLSYVAKFSYGVGHVFNDLCASMWFSYLLMFYQYVVGMSASKAGLILLVGQLADGLSTPVVGIFSDKENKIPACAHYGRRKIWHLMGTIFVLVSFPFIFSPCLGCADANDTVQILYYCFFVILFQFGWASVQISHLSLIPELTAKKHTRTELNSIRYAFTVLSNLSVYTVAFFFLNISQQESIIGCSNSINTTTKCPEPNSTISPGVTISVPEESTVSPEDADEFRNIALFCICAGALFSAIFHFGVKEPPYKDPKKSKAAEGLEKACDISKSTSSQRMRKLDWFKEIAFYQVAVLYMATRLYVNLYQVYIPLYVQDTLHLNKTAIATVPFAMYLAGFTGSLIMKKINKMIGRKGTFSLGCVIGLVGCTAVALGESESYRTWGIYCVAALLGIGGSTVLITSLSITADLIGSNVEGGAFVYGFMSLVDKISNGVVIMIIQNSTSTNELFYRNVITFACGSSCVLGILTAFSLIPVKVSQRRGLSKEVAALVEEEVMPDKTNIVKGPKPENETVSSSVIPKGTLA